MPRTFVRVLLSLALSAVPILSSVHALVAASPITGRVVDESGRPVPGVKVFASAGAASAASAETDNDGRFTLQPLGDGRVTVHVAHDGFRAEAVTVDSTASPRDLGTLTLRVSAISDSIVVSANQVEVPLSEATASVTVIDGGDLESRQLHSVADALRSVPGMTVVSTGGLGATTGVFPRGGESNYSLVVIDGVPANAFGGDFDFGHLPTANVERIEIVRGPQSALFGSNAIGSVVRIVSHRGGAPSGLFQAEGGRYGTSRVAASSSGSVGALEWGGSFDQLLSDGMNGESTATGDIVDNDDYTRRSIAASLGWRHGGSSLRGDVRHARDERGFPGPFGSNPAGIYSGIDLVSRGDNSRTQAGASWSSPLSARVRLQAQAGYNELESDFVSPYGTSQAYSRRWTGRIQSDFTAGRGLDVSGGLELQRERTGSTYITGATAQEIPVVRGIEGYFVEGRWSARERLFVTTGLRVENIRRNRIEESTPSSARPVLPADTIVSANPRFAAAWLARSSGADYTRVRGGVGTGIRPPDGFELAFTDNPGLKPERSVSGEAGLDQAFADGHVLVEATAFANHYDDLIITVGSFSGSSRYQTDNISNARARGFELALTGRGRLARLHGAHVSARIGYTRLSTEILAVDNGSGAPLPFTAGQDLLRRPHHQFFADAALASDRFGVFLRAGGRSKTLDVEPSYGTFGGLFDAPGYQVWSAGASWRIVRPLEVYGRVENLFDRAYEEAFGFPALGRRATAGVRIAAGR
jgi:outer membrane cobalamin receptor